MMVKDILHISLCHGVQKKKDISTLPGGQKYMCAEIHVLFKSTFLSAEAILKPCIEARKKVYLLSICQHVDMVICNGSLLWFERTSATPSMHFAHQKNEKNNSEQKHSVK